MSQAELRAALWQTMLGRAEALHDLVVLSQRRASATAAARIEALANDLSVLARVAAMRAKP